MSNAPQNSAASQGAGAGAASTGINQTAQQQNATANDQSGGTAGAGLGQLGSWLGTISNFQADPYQVAAGDYNPNNYGLTTGQTTGYLQGAQGQAANDYGMSNAANAAQSQFMQQANQAMEGNGPSQALGVLQQGTNAANAN